MAIVHHKNRVPNREWGCPKTKSRTNWCYALCKPDEGMGYCGRPAFHAYRGRTQRAILAQKVQALNLKKAED